MIMNAPHSAKTRKVYSAQRRVDLFTIMVATGAYAFLFAGLRAMDASPWIFAIIAGFITVVGIAQAVLLGGRKPRLSSMIAGGVCLAIIALGLATSRGHGAVSLLMFVLVPSLFPGTLFGYLAGTLVGGIFLVAEKLRSCFAPKA